MATYKVIQDVEAEDKLLGPLTLRQFIYAFIAGILIFLSYFSVARGAIFMLIIFIPPLAVAVFFAFPWNHEQSTEVWALARFRFLFKPRKRIWDQSGVKELVTVTVPKRLDQIYTDGLSQNEVRSRLNALASTLDSRGWAIKNTPSPYTLAYANTSTDRLIDISTMPVDVPEVYVETYTDMLDPTENTTAQTLDTMLSQQATKHHEQLVSSFQQTAPSPIAQTTPLSTTSRLDPMQSDDDNPTPPADFWFLNDPAYNTPQSQVVTPTPPNTTPPMIVAPTHPDPVSDDEESELVEELRQHEIGKAYEYSHLPKILPLAEREKLEKQEALERAKQLATERQRQLEESASRMTEKHDTAILEFAGNNDLSVEAIARQAKKAEQNNDEVVISLH